MKLKSLIAILISFALLGAACEPTTPQETPTPPIEEDNGNENEGDEGNENEGNENEENKGDEETQEPVHPELPDATYTLEHNLDVRVHPLQTNGLRNDYVSFFDVYSDITLFIDFYSPIECDYLPSGHYPLSDGSSMTSAQEYTYITLETGADFIAFSDGSATVTARHDETTGVTTHKVTAYYTMVTGETVSLQYEGVLTIKSGI